MIALGYILAVVMGITLGLIGGGGSILTVPILVYVFELPASQATAYSLFVVGLASVFAAVDYYRRGLLDFKTGIVFAIPAFLGVYLVRRYLMPALPESMSPFQGIEFAKNTLILVVFAIVMLVAAISMIRGRKDEGEAAKKKINLFFVVLEGLLVGGLTGFVGAGGGFMIIPALVILAGLSMKEAVGTSLFIISIKSLFGFVGDIQSELTIDWGFLLIFSAVSILGIFLGTMISRKVDSRLLKPAFGWFVLIMGGLMLIKEVFLS